MTRIHHFCDASQAAHGVVFYNCLVSQDGWIHCSFLVRMPRLAPLKQMTVPRLELSAATVSLCLNKVMEKELALLINVTTFWTDSMTVTRYTESKSNRVTFIRKKKPVVISGNK